MIEFTDIRLDTICVHQVGNKLRDENLKISKENSSFSDIETEKYLLKYFLSPFNNNEVYNFSHPSELDLNEVYIFASRLFSSHDDFYKTSVDISKHLYKKSTHPKINGGELCVCFFKGCSFDGTICDAIGIFKSEIKDVFLRIDTSIDKVNIEHENGINVNKLDKGCLIFNLEKENGYKVCIVDSKSKDTQYWKDEFLNIKPASDNYHFTNNFLGITKQFLTEQLPDDVEISKSEQIDFLNRSVEYFKTNESFNKEDFEGKVFVNEDIIESFRNFDDSYRQENDIELNNDFEISSQAVKKQARAFKRVLKLDANFDIYIKGNKELIERGIDEDGRKFYKIYYDKEK